LEALVQRFGRINRRRKKGIVPVHVYRQPDDGQKIYDKALVAGTLAILDRENGKALDESVVGDWLDEIYSGEVAQRWQEEYEFAAGEFEVACVQTLHPFDADEDLEEEFYRAFDGLQVLPEPLYDEYARLKIENPIQANELLVSISWGRYHALANEGRMLPREKRGPYIVKAPYSSKIGLTFDECVEEDDGWI
jgi:CRISPR-associated endonuclease/helicase Cas3